MNKKIFNHLICSVILIVSTIGILYWIDCSYYQDQIDQLEKTITDLEKIKEWEKQSLIEEGEKKWLNGVVRNSLNWIERNYDKQILQIQWVINELNMEYLQCTLQESSQEIRNVNYEIEIQKQTEYLEAGMESLEQWIDYLENSKRDEAILYLVNASTYFKSVWNNDIADEFLSLTYNALWYAYCQTNKYENAYSYYNNSLNLKYDSETVDDLNSCKEKERNSKKETQQQTNIQNLNCDSYWPGVYLGGDNKCYCKNWYERNYNKNYCVASRDNKMYWWKDFREAKDQGDYINMLLDYEDYMYCLEKWMQRISNCKAYDGAKCICKECESWYELNSVWTSCVAKNNDKLTKEQGDKICVERFWVNAKVYDLDYNQCICKDWFYLNSDKTECIRLTYDWWTELCKQKFWINTKSNPNNYSNCICEDWYVWNSNYTSCIKDSSKSSYSDELIAAYNFAYNNWITTADNIDKANMNWKLSRIAMAKMLSQYAINILWKEPNTHRNCVFSDVTNNLDKAYDYWVTLACQLWVMWVWMNNFRPKDNVTRAEFATALSRMLFELADWTDKYYSTHLDKLFREGIITNMNPKLEERRWYVMLMLMRSTN